MNQPLQIEKPCPFVPTARNQTGGGFYCKGCKKVVHDMRGKTQDEIRSYKGQDFCGIFTTDQLPGQRRMKFSRQMAFSFMTLLSLLGFTVKPMSVSGAGQPYQGKMVNHEFSAMRTDKNDEEGGKKKNKKNKKKKKHRRLAGSAF
jgi:hypothetical protein